MLSDALISLLVGVGMIVAAIVLITGYLRATKPMSKKLQLYWGAAFVAEAFLVMLPVSPYFRAIAYILVAVMAAAASAIRIWGRPEP